jgi:hypothetical protein
MYNPGRVSPEALFSIAGSVVLPGWALLVFAPRWRWTAGFVASVLIPGLLAAVYVYLIATRWAGAAGGFGSLADVRRLFDDPGLLLAGWIHYLAFDLFVGSWEIRDAQRLGIPHLAVVPCLVLTFLFGPAGWLLYFVVRAVLRRRVLADDTATSAG